VRNAQGFFHGNEPWLHERDDTEKELKERSDSRLHSVKHPKTDSWGLWPGNTVPATKEDSSSFLVGFSFLSPSVFLVYTRFALNRVFTFLVRYLLSNIRLFHFLLI